MPNGVEKNMPKARILLRTEISFQNCKKFESFVIITQVICGKFVKKSISIYYQQLKFKCHVKKTFHR